MWSDDENGEWQPIIPEHVQEAQKDWNFDIALVSLRDQRGFTYAQIAGIFDIHPATARKKIERARRRVTGKMSPVEKYISPPIAQKFDMFDLKHRCHRHRPRITIHDG